MNAMVIAKQLRALAKSTHSPHEAKNAKAIARRFEKKQQAIVRSSKNDSIVVDAIANTLIWFLKDNNPRPHQVIYISHKDAVAARKTSYVLILGFFAIMLCLGYMAYGHHSIRGTCIPGTADDIQHCNANHVRLAPNNDMPDRD